MAAAAAVGSSRAMDLAGGSGGLERSVSVEWSLAVSCWCALALRCCAVVGMERWLIQGFVCTLHMLPRASLILYNRGGMARCGVRQFNNRD
jgi:hypothetical protein